MAGEQGGGGDLGYGQFNPADGNADENVIAFIVRQMLGQVDTMKLVKVVKVTPGQAAEGGVAPPGTVDVVPLINQIDGNGNATKHGTVFGLPWLRIGGGKNAVAIDPEVDDIGIAVVSDRDISNVKSTKKQANPGSLRKFDIADGVYLGAILSAAPERYVVMNSDGLKAKDKDGNEVAMTSTGIKLTDKSGNVLEMKDGGIFVTGNLVVSGNLQLAGSVQDDSGGLYGGDIVTGGEVVAKSGAANVHLSTHLHSGVTTGGGQSGVPVPGS